MRKLEETMRTLTLLTLLSVTTRLSAAQAVIVEGVQAADDLGGAVVSDLFDVLDSGELPRSGRQFQTLSTRASSTQQNPEDLVSGKDHFDYSCN